MFMKQDILENKNRILFSGYGNTHRQIGTQ